MYYAPKFVISLPERITASANARERIFELCERLENHSLGNSYPDSSLHNPRYAKIDAKLTHTQFTGVGVEAKIPESPDTPATTIEIDWIATLNPKSAKAKRQCDRCISSAIMELHNDEGFLNFLNRFDYDATLEVILLEQLQTRLSNNEISPEEAEGELYSKYFYNLPIWPKEWVPIEEQQIIAREMLNLRKEFTAYLAQDPELKGAGIKFDNETEFTPLAQKNRELSWVEYTSSRMMPNVITLNLN